ncbi:YihY/virulence factor BrkB family protein [Paludibaculum fermentans]|uniref:YihY/virulence factor BrkB family protein n=1 Tax=Paludibaculum fermentans TaxID=1473598 RepID=A0A7S7NPM0_PALFE|nr:YihY/virulence factor BrkB family protein [Paludibaculum fermentans]QOY87394.1 YihY/virulence factor BrkB family protein [Paludibaculum fermentans]
MYSLPSGELAALIGATFRSWQEDRAPRMGAALAYYLAISLAPTVVIILAVAGWAFGSQAAEGRLVWQIQDLVGLEGAKVIQSMIDGAHQPLRGVTASLLGLITLFFGATAVVSELRDSLNTIWKVPDDATFSTGRTLLEFLKARMVSFVMVLGAGLFLLASLILNVWISFAGEYLRSVAAPPPALIRIADWVISFTVITALLAFIFKVLPNVQLEWSDVAVGAVLTSLLFAAGRFLLSVYLTKAGFKDSYGAAGSLVVLLVWVYYSAQVLYLGAEFTRAYARRYGSMVVTGFQS